MSASILILNNIKLPINASIQEAFSVSIKRLKKYSAYPANPVFRIYRKSVDARRRGNIFFVYSVAVEGEFPQISKSALADMDATFDSAVMPVPHHGSDELSSRPIVVGSGPCGLFAALLLAERGYMPIILERGGSVRERISAIDDFRKTRKLNVNTNIQFGAGGAGTFSDGKLVTRTNDALTSYVLKRFVEFGAPEDILYQAKPHIGTDILCVVVEKMIERITALGGEIRYHTRFIGNKLTHGKIQKVSTSEGDIDTGAVILALGHSARDTYCELMTSGVCIEAKNFSVGMRIEHLCADIDRAMYGDFAGHSALGHGEYNLSYNTKQRGVYTFCMCPGGEVVTATSEDGGVVVNGMSQRSRNGVNSNSAVVCSVFKEDYGATPMAAIEFQRKIERAAFSAAGENYSAPIILLSDFMEDKLTREPSKIIPTYMGGEGVKIASPYDYLPSFVCDSIKNAIPEFNKKISCFADGEAVLTGAETRTSAPIRIIRDNTSRLALGFDNLYPAGEGAGYAGGISSAAIDGVKTAIALIERYKPLKND